ncbi:MAG: hypothetical protein HY936_02965 [Nitrosomonadales bacterium]|nr:hypothetical protein [Nitrosomonadales bacterium]
MEWDFTPEQVVKAEVDYGLEQFRLDLFEEVRLNMNQMDDAQQRKIFDVMYDLCYWVATGGDYDEFLAGLDKESFFPSFLGSIKEMLVPNIMMLGAILQRLIMERVDEQTIPLEEALKQVDGYHRLVVTKTALN